MGGILSGYQRTAHIVCSSDCCLRDWFYWLIRVLLVDKGCITQLNRLGDLGNKLGDLPPKISQNYPNHPFGAAKRPQKGSPPSSPMSLCVLEFSPIFVPRITIQAFSSNASRPHSSNHCLQARCIESSFYRVLEASKIEQYLL